MKHSRLIFLCLILTVALLVPGALVAQGNGNGPRNAFDHEPVLIYEVSGSTIAGPTYLLLTVYSDGDATLVQQDAPNVPEELCQATLRADQLRQLQQNIRRFGLVRLGDQRSSQVPDVPLTTVTVFQAQGNSGRSTANTFSYYVPQNRYSQVEDAIRSFIATAFASC